MQPHAKTVAASGVPIETRAVIDENTVGGQQHGAEGVANLIDAVTAVLQPLDELLTFLPGLTAQTIEQTRGN